MIQIVETFFMETKNVSPIVNTMGADGLAT